MYIHTHTKGVQAKNSLMSAMWNFEISKKPCGYYSNILYSI